jgi:hypothetical protein
VVAGGAAEGVGAAATGAGGAAFGAGFIGSHFSILLAAFLTASRPVFRAEVMV